MVAWESYQKEPASEATIKHWIESWPNANIGLVTGAISDCIVIDLDSDEARDKVKSLVGDYDLQAVPRTRTGKGWQLFFKHPEVSIPNRTGVLPNMDVRGDGGYVVVPPSIHPNGKEYTWEVPLNGHLPQIPGELYSLITSGSSHNGTAGDHGRFDVWRGISEGQRDHELFRYACQLRSFDAPRDVADRLILEAAALCRPPFPTDKALEKVTQAWKYPAGHSNGTTNGNGHAEGGTHQPLIITMDQVKAEKIDWLWDNRIPIGRLTLLDGDPGSGKSFLSLEIASRVSRGEALPFGGKKRSPANVLLMSCEDGYSDTVRPRLDRLGADVSRIAIPNPQRGLSTTMLNASFIEQAVKELGPSLVVIDPIVAFAGRKNTDKANEVRELLSPLMSIAERYALACLVIRHFTKQVDAKAMYRGGGSVDFMAACRCAFIIVESEDEPNMRVLAQVKNSIGSKSLSVSFCIDENGFRWGGHVAANADELLASSRSDNRREKVQLEAAESFLRETLSNGPMTSNGVKDKAEAAGIANKTLWRAKDTLNIKATKERGSLGGEWWWRLPAAGEEPRARAGM